MFITQRERSIRTNILLVIRPVHPYEAIPGSPLTNKFLQHKWQIGSKFIPITDHVRHSTAEIALNYHNKASGCSTIFIHIKNYTL